MIGKVGGDALVVVIKHILSVLLQALIMCHLCVLMRGELTVHLHSIIRRDVQDKQCVTPHI